MSVIAKLNDPPLTSSFILREITRLLENNRQPHESWSLESVGEQDGQGERDPTIYFTLRSPRASMQHQISRQISPLQVRSHRLPFDHLRREVQEAYLRLRVVP
jgi:hypothetical protein